MRLTRVVVENYRGLKNLVLDLDQITVLVGENNSGKTSVLDAVRTCLGRPLSRRGNPFEDHDYLLATNKAKPGDAGKLKIRLEFNEATAGEWPADVIQALGDVIIVQTSGLRIITLEVTSELSAATKDFTFDWDFLDGAGKAIPKGKRPQNLVDLQRMVPVHYLSALRDAAREFQSRSTFWAPFLRNPSIPQNVQDDLEKELAKLNDQILKAEPRLAGVKATLAKTQGVVRVGSTDTVSIDALPTHVWEMLSRAQVNVAAATGAKLPLLRHGAGTQSLSVLFLFEAFLNAGLGGADPNSTPILQLEEPEAHLHPSAARALWACLDAIKGQKIVTTHSGDLLSEVPLEAIRRLYRRAGDINIGGLKQGTLSADEARKIHYHVKRTRGELFFARCWLLVEGETEYWSFMGAASAAGLDLERAGIRIVEYTNVGAVPLTKLADDLGIWWHVVGDADQAGQDVARSVRARLLGRQDAEHISLLPEQNMEVVLCKAGHVDIYSNHIPQQNRAQITATVGTPLYCEQVASLLPKKAKTACALEVYERLKTTPNAVIPQALTDILARAKTLSDR